MKLLVISDTHRSLYKVYSTIDSIKDMIDGVIHCGDIVDDVDILKNRYPNLRFYNVRGNCDYGCGAEDEKVITFGGKKIFITHGHNYSVGYNLMRLCYRAEELQVDACVFGHTHIPVLENYNGIVIMNPGSLAQPRGNSVPSYGILTVENDIIRGNIVEYK